jgi:hypothetical protein
MRMQGRKTLYQVGIAVKEVFAVGGIYTSFSFANKQLVAGQQIKEVVSPDADIVLLKEWLQHHQQLTATAARLLFADAKYLLDDALVITGL